MNHYPPIAVATIALITWLQASAACADSLGKLTGFAKHVTSVRTYADEEGFEPAGEVPRVDFRLPKDVLKRSDYDFALVEHGGKRIWVDQGQFKVEGHRVKVVDGGGPDMGRGSVKTTGTRGMGED